MKYFVGIDGGGTKTAFICMNEQNECVAECTLESCHVLQVSEERAIEILKTGISKLRSEIQNDDHPELYICAGLAGYGKDIKLRERIEKICEKSFEKDHYVICNDGEIALAGALNGEDGILVIAGTGSIAIAKKGNENLRCGGWGYTLGDEGSAYWIARQLIQEFAKQCDGRHKPTLLREHVKHSCGLNDEYDMISYVSDTLGNEREKIAKLALLVYELAVQNDEAALSIYDRAAQEIAEMINTLALHFPDGCNVSYAGGVWAAGSYLIEPLKKYLHNGITFEAPQYTPEIGAQLIARQTFQSQ